ncbi:hypothetical protein BGZ83_011914 [Gryganskiella cystojenkinii]|nr:hypothetical protein BGZ83_011914 [Gryganskiella cystojenkinii]
MDLPQRSGLQAVELLFYFLWHKLNATPLPHIHSNEDHDKLTKTMPLIYEVDQQDQQETAMTDWTVIISICYQLRVPGVFLSREAIQDSHESSAVADAFVNSVYPLLERLESLLKSRSINDTYVLRRVMIACAAFTNPKDLWNARNPAVDRVVAIAKENLRTLYHTTPWTMDNTSFKTSTEDSASSSPSTGSRGIQGTFSDHVIDILANVLRPTFANVQAQKAMDRAQLTIQAHQEVVRQSTRLIQDLSTNQTTEADGVLATATQSRDLTTMPLLRSVPRPRFQIAEVKDTPNEEDDLSEIIENPDRDNSRLRWNTNFLESIALVEWCAQQTIQDVGRVQEVFMLLLAPTLALAESTQSRHRIRGLDLMSQFLIRYQDVSSSFSTTAATTSSKVTPATDPRIWIRIFERTGLDQVLERALIPILTPFNASITSDDILARMTLNSDAQADTTNVASDALEDLEAVRAGFRAYLTLILVNTEPEDRPQTLEGHGQGHGQSSFLASRKSLTEAAVTVENLFTLAVLGGLGRASPSKEFRAMVLEWTECLVSPIIAFDRIRDQMPQDKSLCLEPTARNSATEEKGEDSTFLAIYGLGDVTTKYLITLVPYLCDVLEIPIPSSPPRTRLDSLKLAGQASDTLRAVMAVTRARVSRLRGKIMSALAACWANSRLYPSSSRSTSAATAATLSLRTSVEMAQARLDASLPECMQLCVEICRGTGQQQQQDKKIVELEPSIAKSGVDQDLEILLALDPSVFSPLFALLSN